MTEILVRLERIDTKLEDRDLRLRRVESVVGRQTFVAALVSAGVAGVVLAFKFAVSGGK